MEHDMNAEQLGASFDLVARQDAADQVLGALRSDVEEVKSRLDKVARAPLRPMLGGGSVGDIETKGFVDGYLRRGRETELKSINDGSGVTGGYLVPTELDAKIASRLLTISPIRKIAQVVQTSTADYRKLISLGGTTSGWVSEMAARPETGEPAFAEIIPPSGELYANPSATQHMLDDPAFDLEGWLASQISAEFARAEGAAFVTGSGSGQPAGFLAAPVSAAPDAARTFGTLQYVASGNADGFDIQPDAHLIDMVMALNPGHRQGACWAIRYMKPPTCPRSRRAPARSPLATSMRAI